MEKAPTARPPVDLASVEHRLRQILEPYRDRLVVTREGSAGFTLEVPGLEGKPWGFVAATRVGKRYVSFHLMGLYASPELLSGMSPELRRRMQGKSCFNFTMVDESLMPELERLTAASVDRLRELALAHAAAHG